MTSEDQLKEEWQYRRLEREGILTDGRRPPDAQERDIARAEADLWIADWRKAHELL